MLDGVFSALQTSEIKVPLLASIEAGQVLDPVNNAVEWLSSTLVWAIGSLFILRVLLEVSASSIFKWFLCGIGIGMILFLLLTEWRQFRVSVRRTRLVSDNMLERFASRLVQLFLLGAIFRFIAPVFVALSFFVSQHFVDSAISRDSEQLTNLRAEVSGFESSPASSDQALKTERDKKEGEIISLRETLASSRLELEKLDAQIEHLDEEVDQLRKLSENLEDVREELEDAEEDRQKRVQEKKSIEDEIKRIESELKCIDEPIAVDSCELLFDEKSNGREGDNSRPTDELKKLQSERTETERQLDEDQDSLEKLRRDIRPLDAVIEELKKEKRVPWILDSEELKEKKKRRKELAREEARLENAIKENEDALACINKRVVGESCSFSFSEVFDNVLGKIFFWRADLNKKLENERNSLSKKQSEIDDLDKEMDGWKQDERRFQGRLESLKDAPIELQEAKKRRKELAKEETRLEDEIKESEDALECINIRIAGGSCDSSKDVFSNLMEVLGMPALDKLNQVKNSIVNLLVAIAIKNILLPILFLVLVVKCSVPIIRGAFWLSRG